MSRLDELPAAATLEGAGQTVDEGRGRIFPCESCGADLEFHIGQQRLRCPFCGYAKELTPDPESVGEQRLEAMLERMVELRRLESEQLAETRVIDCKTCGAEVEFTGTLTSTRCAYCGSPVQRDEVHTSERRVPVDGVMPFAVDERRAREHMRRWMGSLWFAPNDFKKQSLRGELEGVYLPFWTYDAMTYSRYRGERGEHYYTGSGKSRKRNTRWHRASGEFQRFFDDVLVAAGRSLPSGWLEALEPWPLDGCQPFNEELLAGYLAQTYDVPLDEGFEEARRRIDDALRAETRQRIGGDAQRIHDLSTSYSALTYKHLLLPVWSLGYRYHGKGYQVVISGATGEVQGQRPYSPWKIAFAVLLVLFVVVLVLWLGGG